ncbi:MAG: FkbM family methyltransferase, partial [Rhizobiaceae bacterium]|nr:FkbM family methyltransferase [Rhizobiaceae bacterium]
MTVVRRVVRVLSRDGLKGAALLVRAAIAYVRLGFMRMLDRPVVRSAYGLRLAANYGDDTFGYYVSGAYGFFYWDRLATLDFPFVLLDIGANQGLYAIGAARSPNCVASYAFEPVPRTFGYLKKNIALNGANACCVPVMKAIGEKTGVAEMALKDGHSGVATLASSNPLMEESGSKLAV